jgi:hypothetical protein
VVTSAAKMTEKTCFRVSDETCYRSHASPARDLCDLAGGFAAAAKVAAAVGLRQPSRGSRLAFPACRNRRRRQQARSGDQESWVRPIMHRISRLI